MNNIIFDKLVKMFDYKNDFFIKNACLIALHGSHAYGTNIESSDIDIKGYCIGEKRHYLGLAENFEQVDKKIESYDITIYEIRKFCKLAADCNPNIIELLFIDDSDILYISDAGQTIRNARNAFLSKKAKYTFSGYATSQFKRIKTHRSWLLNPLQKKPERSDFGLSVNREIPKNEYDYVMSVINKKIDSWQLDLSYLNDDDKNRIMSNVKDVLFEKTAPNEFFRACQTLGMNDETIHKLCAEKSYADAIRQWQQYQEWKTNRNEKRAALEAKHGYDTKHAMHLVRLMRMAVEILKEKTVYVKRHDKDELLEIRNGKWTYEQLENYVSQCQNEIDVAYAKSTLQKTSDINQISKIVEDIILKVIS